MKMRRRVLWAPLMSKEKRKDGDDPKLKKARLEKEEREQQERNATSLGASCGEAMLAVLKALQKLLGASTDSEWTHAQAGATDAGYLRHA